MAYRAALKATQRRTVAAWPSDPHEVRILLILPDGEESLRAAWRFALEIDVPRSNIAPVVLGERLNYSPDAFAGAVDIITKKDLDWRRLPNKKVLQAFWSPHPHVAIDFTSPFSAASAYLAGASTAHFRIGLYDKAAEPFFDFLIAPTESFEAALRALRGYLESIDPPAIAFKKDR
ncbi:MAG: hypothetical protein IH855_08105 [Bacteroidetes bacterium]|nr:hypothetical protein [Bacteroidota bacterium]